MKTTIDIADSLLEEARRLAARRSTTLKALVEAGLRRELRESAKAAPFELRAASFRGQGLRPELVGASWDRVRELAYEERGG
jgi:Arc/MetJ family transcription regulator